LHKWCSLRKGERGSATCAPSGHAHPSRIPQRPLAPAGRRSSRRRGRRPGALNSKEAAGICAAGSTSTPCPARFAAPAGRTASPRFTTPPGAPLRREFVEVGARELREDGVPLDGELTGAREGEVGRRGRGRRRRNRGPAPPQLRIRGPDGGIVPMPSSFRADLRRRRRRKGPRPTQGLKVVVGARRKGPPPPQGPVSAAGARRRCRDSPPGAASAGAREGGREGGEGGEESSS
jgi:hypothetical protein